MVYTDNFSDLSLVEQVEIDGGGFLSAAAGTLAGAMIGAYAGMVPSIVTGDISYVGKSVVTGATVGLWAGLGCPLP